MGQPHKAGEICSFRSLFKWHEGFVHQRDLTCGIHISQEYYNKQKLKFCTLERSRPLQ